MKRLLFIFLILFVSLYLFSEEKWITSNVSFYKIYYTAESKNTIKEIENLLAVYDKDMQNFIHTEKTNIKFNESNVEIYLYPKNNTVISLYNTENNGGTYGDQNKITYKSVFKICDLNAYGKDTDTFYRNLFSELAPVYLHSLCSVNNVRFYDLDKWFYNGFRQYIGVYHSTDYWKNSGYKSFISRLKDQPNGISTENGLKLSDNYKDGFLMFQFFRDIYNEEVMLKIMLNKEATFEKKCQEILTIDSLTLYKQIETWKKKKVAEI